MHDRYLELLSDFDLRILGAASNMVDPDHAAAWFRTRRGHVTAAISRPSTFEALFPDHCLPNYPESVEPTPVELGADEIRIVPSAFLFFSVLIHKAASDLVDASLRTDRIGNHTFARVDQPLMGSETAQNPDLRLHLAEMLDSFSPSRSTRGWDALAPAAAKIDEKNPADLIRLLSTLSPDETPGIYRRLGDLALFRSGLTALNTEPTPVTEIEAANLASSLPGGLAHARFAEDLNELLSSLSSDEALQELGPIWLRMAADGVSIPAISSPLSTIADYFDDAVGFLRYLAKTFGLHRSSALVGLSEPT